MTERESELVRQLAEAQSKLGDALARIAELEGAVKKHQAATFGHSACFIRDRELWAAAGLTAPWPVDSLPLRHEFREGCRAYEEDLFGPED